MEKILIIAIILYALFVCICFLRMQAKKKRKKNIVGKGSTIRELGSLKTDIVGKSKFDKSALTPLATKSKPLAANSQKSDNAADIPNIFASENEINPTAEVSSEELDETFSDTPSDETELMDIDYPLEYETEDEAVEDEETEEVEGMVQAALASGVQFEDLGNAVRTVANKEKASSEQKQAAGNTLLEIRQTDMFEQLVSGKPDVKETVSQLMAESLAAFHRRKDKEAGNSGSGKKVPDNFNIRDFA